MSRTRMLNVAGIVVALVLAGSWALGVLWGGHDGTAAAARTPSRPAATATGTPSGERVHPGHARQHRLHAAATPSTDAATASATATSGPAGAHATAHHSPSSHPTSGGSHPSPSPSSHPSSGGGSGTPTPSPSPSGNLLTGLLGGLGGLGH